LSAMRSRISCSSACFLGEKSQIAAASGIVASVVSVG
jgi:hypothetical protein